MSLADLAIAVSLAASVTLVVALVRRPRPVPAGQRSPHGHVVSLLVLLGLVPGIVAWVAAYLILGATHGLRPALESPPLLIAGLATMTASATCVLSRELVAATSAFRHASAVIERVRTLLEGEGLQTFFLKGRDGDVWQDHCRARVKAWKDVDLLVVTGFATFGKEDSLLAPFVHAPGPGRLRVLFLNPESHAFRARAARVDRTPAAYFAGVEASIAALERLRHKGGQVEYRFYDWEPIWRLYVGSNEAFFQHVSYASLEASRPIYSIAQTHETGSLFPAFQLYFEEMWRQAKGPTGKTKTTCEKYGQAPTTDGSLLFRLASLRAMAELASTNDEDQPESSDEPPTVAPTPAPRRPKITTPPPIPTDAKAQRPRS